MKQQIRIIDSQFINDLNDHLEGKFNMKLPKFRLTPDTFEMIGSFKYRKVSEDTIYAACVIRHIQSRQFYSGNSEFITDASLVKIAWDDTDTDYYDNF